MNFNEHQALEVTESDLVDILLIENECHFSPWTKINFLDAIEAKNLFKVFKKGNVIIGYFVALVAYGECQLLNIAIKIDFQRKGFGQIILNDLMNYCKKNNVTNIFLEVRRSNKSAICLYEKNGFNELGVRNNYYKKKEGREDGILMGLSL